MRKRILLGADGLPLGWKLLAENDGYAMVVLPSRDLTRLKELRIVLDAGTTRIAR